MLLINRIEVSDLINYRQEYLECLKHNISNTVISKILIYVNDPGHNIPKLSNKVDIYFKKNASIVDVIENAKRISTSENLIFANPLCRFNSDLYKAIAEISSNIITDENNYFIFHKSTFLSNVSSVSGVFPLNRKNLGLNVSKTISGQIVKERESVSDLKKSKQFIKRPQVNRTAPIVESKPNTGLSNFTEIIKDPVRKREDRLKRKKFVKDLGQPKTIIRKSVVPEAINEQSNKIKKLDLVIVSVNYNDLLVVSLEHNSKLFENITVVTSTDDVLCQKICQKFGVSCVTTDVMYEHDSVFNKARAINEGIKSLKNPDFILLIDADIVIKDKIDIQILNENILYTSDRWICKSYGLLQSWQKGEIPVEKLGRNEGNKGIGFFQLFNISNPNIDKESPYPDVSKNAAWSDLVFRDKFTVRNAISNTIIHLGDPYKNWDGRVSNKFLNDDQFSEILNRKPSYTICSFYFNYNNDWRQKRNFIKFLEQWKSHLDSVIVGVVDYGDIDFDIPCRKITIEGDKGKRIWSKEVLINKIAKEVDTDYLIFIDGDIIYEDLSWLDNLEEVIGSNDFVQLFETINYLGETGEIIETHKSIASGDTENVDLLLSKGFRPGGSWMTRTKLLKSKPLFEKMLVGGGDTIMAYGIYGQENGWTLGKVKEGSVEVYEEAKEWIKNFGRRKCSYLGVNVNHLYHGDLKDRNYNERYSKLIDIKSKRIVVFTENIGEYDHLKPISKYKNTTCVAFLDKDVEIEGWNVININNYPHISGLKDIKLICKYVRTHPNEILPEHDYSIHIDANMLLTEDPNKIVDEIAETNNEIMVFRHHKRNSIYEEGEKCIESKLDNESIIYEQLEKYRNFGIGTGLYECGLMVRKNTESVRKFDDIWWKEISRYSKRDQISFPYATSLAGVSVGTFRIEDRRKTNLIKIDKDKRGNYIPTPHKKSRIFNNNLCFVYDDGRENWGSTKMRGRDIAKKIGCNIVSFKESKDIKYKKIVLLKMSSYEKSLCLTEFNEVVCDMVDFNKGQHNLDTFKGFDYGIFTSVKQMEELRHIFKSPEKCRVIYHHWDERFNNIRVRDGISSPRICYIGQPEKCYGKNTNIERHSIDWYDFDEKISLYEQYNVHYVVKPKVEDNKIQPLTKISTASSLGCPVIANRSDHNIEILGIDYPYLCDPNDGSVEKVIEKVYNTFGKVEWYRALEKMKEIKEMTSLKSVTKNYLDIGYIYQKDEPLMRIEKGRMKIHGFYFAALINDWKPIVIDQLERLFHSSLFNETDTLFIRVYYTIESDMDDFNKIVDSYRNNLAYANIRIYSTDENEYEFGILNLMKDLATKDEFYCYYLHSKGVSKIPDSRRTEAIRAWRKYMEYFLIDKYSSCIDSLEGGYDAVGVKIRETPASMEKVSGLPGKFWWASSGYMSVYSRSPRHFSGNFWWSKSSYIMSLPDIDIIRSGDRHEAEFWIGYADGEMKCLHSGERAGYGQSIKEEEYMTENINHF